MRLAILQKEEFVHLLKLGKVMVPECQSEAVDKERNTEKAKQSILEKCGALGPLESLDRCIFIEYADGDSPCVIAIEDVKSITAASKEAHVMFTSQFRRDLLIKMPKDDAAAENYDLWVIKKMQAGKGLDVLASMWGLNVTPQTRNQIIESTLHGFSYRNKYRYISKLPAECYEQPYSVMLTYERYRPYPNDIRGYFFDAVELLCHFSKPGCDVPDSMVERTSIYSRLIGIRGRKEIQDIHKAIKDENFTSMLGKIFPDGGYLVPVLFFWMRDIFRHNLDFAALLAEVSYIKDNEEPEVRSAFNMAALCFGAFFGYDAFYDAWYEARRLPIIKFPDSAPKQQPVKSGNATAVKSEKSQRKPGRAKKSGSRRKPADAKKETKPEDPNLFSDQQQPERHALTEIGGDIKIS